jgi:hypothetical protein
MLMSPNTLAQNLTAEPVPRSPLLAYTFRRELRELLDCGDIPSSSEKRGDATDKTRRARKLTSRSKASPHDRTPRPWRRSLTSSSYAVPFLATCPVDGRRSRGSVVGSCRSRGRRSHRGVLCRRRQPFAGGGVRTPRRSRTRPDTFSTDTAVRVLREPSPESTITRTSRVRRSGASFVVAMRKLCGLGGRARMLVPERGVRHEDARASLPVT